MTKESTIALLTLLLLAAAPAPPPSVCPPWGAPTLAPPVPCCPAGATALYYEGSLITCVPDEPPAEDSYRHNASPS